MEIKAIQLKKFYKNSDSMYKNIIITSLRARQIIDERYEKVSIEENIEDSDQLEALIVEDVDFDEPKAITIAVKEFMDNEFEWKKMNEEEIVVDEK